MLLDRPNDAGEGRSGETARDLLEACAEAARGAVADNTERARRSDLRLFTAWCEVRGVSALPASAETLAAFVEAMARARAPATVRRYVATIRAAHRAIGADHATKKETVRLALQRMHRRKGRRQEQARGLTGALRQRLLEATGDDLIGARDRALLAVAYDTLLRRSELVALLVPDIIVEVDATATVLVRRSKTDAEGRGAQLYLARDSVAFVKEWLARAGIAKGRVFRSLARGALGETLDAGTVSRIFKRMARNAGLPGEVVGEISGHSTRVGATQDMVAAGIGMPAIMDSGRWKTTKMVHRYGERLLARRSGAAQLARLQQRG